MAPYRQPKLRQQPARRSLLQRGTFPAALTQPLFASSRDPLLLIDSTQIVRAANPAACALLQQCDAQLCGRHWRLAFQLERELARAWRRNPVVQCLLSRREQELSDDTYLVSGEQRLALQGKVLPVASGRQLFALFYFYPHAAASEAHSLGRRNDHELMLQHMSRLNTVSELATGIAHEMNQPLSAIMSFNQAALRLMAEAVPDVDRASEALAEAVNQTRRAAGILERLRAFVSRQGLQLQPVAVNQVVINALTLLSNKLGESGVRVSLHTQPCPPVQADALQLEQVMVNLIRNAIEAMANTAVGQRSLHIDTHTVAGRVHVAVTDSGPGISSHINDQLFTRFFSTKSDGMGLGLSISRTILEAAAGELSVSNIAGSGACFRFSLPVCRTEEIHHEHSRV